MERRRLQQQKTKQQKRISVSQQDLTQAIAHMKPQRRATHGNLMSISSSPSLSSCSIETVTIPSVSQLIKEFEARTGSTPYVSAQDFIPNNNVVVSSDGIESNCCQQIPDRTMNLKFNEQFTGDKEQINQFKRDLPTSSPSSYYSVESSNNTADMSALTKRFSEIRAKEVELNNALADLISLSNDADISSSMSSSSRSLLNNSQRRRGSSVNENTNSISTSIALLNHLLETFDTDMAKIKKENNDKNENIKPINMFW
jgi:hypothetical protein